MAILVDLYEKTIVLVVGGGKKVCEGRAERCGIKYIVNRFALGISP
jgi:hypothetical protein